MAISQSHYRFGIDELAESTHGWHAAEDTDPGQGVIAVDTTFLLRFVSQCDGTAQSNVDCEYQVSRNGGAYQNITTTSTIVKAVAATALTNGGNCTQRLSGTGTFETSGAGQTEDGISGGTANDIVANGNSECECGLQIVGADVAGGDVLTFRLTRDGGTLYNSYLVTPTLTLPRTLAGAEFTSPASFPAGSVGPPGTTITGVAFTSPATFFAGQLNYQLQGAAFTSPANFPAGALSLGLLGQAFASPASFPIGSLDDGSEPPPAGYPATLLSGGLGGRWYRDPRLWGPLPHRLFPWAR